MARRQTRRCLRVLRGRYQGRGTAPFCSIGGNLGNGRTRTAMYTDSLEQLRGTAGTRQVRVRADSAVPGAEVQRRVAPKAGPLRPMIDDRDFEAGTDSDRREPVISSVTGRRLACLPNMIRPPLLGVVNATSAVSARTLTCRAPAVPRSCSMLSEYIAVRQRPVPKLPPLEQNGCGPRP